MRGIFNNDEVVLLRQTSYGIMLAGLAGQVNSHDRFGFGCDFPFNLCGVDLVYLGIHRQRLASRPDTKHSLHWQQRLLVGQ